MKAIIFILALTAVFCEELEFESHISIDAVREDFNFINMISDTQKIIFNSLITIRSGSKINIKEDLKRLSPLCVSGASVEVSNLEKLLKALFTRKAKMPEEKFEVLKATFKESKYVDKNVWYGFEIVFNADPTDKDKVNYVNIFINYIKDRPNVFSFICNKGFKFAPDVMIFTKGLSVAGGIYERTEDVLKEFPKSITKEEIETMMDMFLLISMKKYAVVLGYNTSSWYF